MDTGVCSNLNRKSSERWEARFAVSAPFILQGCVSVFEGFSPAPQLPSKPASISPHTAPEWSGVNSAAIQGGYPTPDSDSADHQRRLARLNSERRKEMAIDTDRLLALAHDLDAEMSESNTEKPPVDGLQKAAQIEKLAHSVREKMKAMVSENR